LECLIFGSCFHYKTKKITEGTSVSPHYVNSLHTSQSCHPSWARSHSQCRRRGQSVPLRCPRRGYIRDLEICRSNSLSPSECRFLFCLRWKTFWTSWAVKCSQGESWSLQSWIQHQSLSRRCTEIAFSSFAFPYKDFNEIRLNPVKRLYLVGKKVSTLS